MLEHKFSHPIMCSVYYMFLFFSRTGLAGVKRKALANELLGDLPEVLFRKGCYKKANSVSCLDSESSSYHLIWAKKWDQELPPELLAKFVNNFFLFVHFRWSFLALCLFSLSFLIYTSYRFPCYFSSKENRQLTFS
jgi:hypothetical protein